MRIVYFGSGAFGLPTLRRLVRDHEVGLVVSQPDRPAGRGRAARPTPIAALAEDRGLPLLKPADVNAPDIVAEIRRRPADAWIVIAFGQKLGPALLEGVFAVNLHASLLPRYRGAAPINRAIIEGERETGLSVITLADRMDAGAVLGQSVTPIDPMETAGELHDRLAELGPDLVAELLERHRAGTLRATEQDEARATRAPKLTKADGTVRFDRPAEVVRNRIHGLTPWPGCRIELAGRPLALLRARTLPGEAGAAPGRVRDDGAIACAEGAIALLSVQPPGGRAMSFEAYRLGHAVPPGSIARAVGEERRAETQ